MKCQLLPGPLSYITATENQIYRWSNSTQLQRKVYTSLFSRTCGGDDKMI